MSRPCEARHVVLLRGSDIVADTRAKKMAVSLARLGFQVTVLCATLEKKASTAELPGVTIMRVPTFPSYSDAAGVVRRQRQAWRPKLAPSRHQHSYLRFRNRFYLNRARALKGRALRGRRALVVMPRIELFRERIAIAVTRRVFRFRSKAQIRIEKFMEDSWAAYNARRARSSASWRTDWVHVRELEARFAQRLQTLRPDIIHAHDLNVLQIAVDAADCARLDGRQVSVVYDAIENWAGLPEEDYGTPRMRRVFLSLEQEYAPLAEGVITVSDEIADVLARRYRLKDRPSVVFNVPVFNSSAPRGETVRDRIGLDPAIPLLLYSGGITASRGIDFLVRALKELPEFHLALIAVPWPSRAGEALAEVAESVGAADRFHLIPPVDPEDLIPFLSGATIGVHPLARGAENHEMALPNKLFEYVHAGLPLLVNNTRAMSKFVREHRLGEVFTDGDTASLGDGVRRILNAQPGTYIMDEERIAWCERFSWQAMEPAIARLYGRTVGSEFSLSKAPFPSLRETCRRDIVV